MNPEIPQHIYVALGLLVVTNLGAIGTLLMVTFKAVWWSAKLESKVDECRGMAVRAHKRIDGIEGAPQ